MKMFFFYCVILRITYKQEITDRYLKARGAAEDESMQPSVESRQSIAESRARVDAVEELMPSSVDLDQESVRHPRS